MNHKRSILIAICCALILVGGWFGWQYYLDNVKAPAITPAQVVDKYFELLKARDYKAAFAMVSHDHYFDTFNQFIDRVSMYAPDMVLKVTNDKIAEDGKTAVVDVRLEVPMRYGMYKSDSTMDLVRNKRQWLILHP